MDLGGEATGWVVAVTGAITGVGALVLNRRSQAETAEMQTAANRIARDKHRLEETQQALDAMEAVAERANADAARYHDLWQKAEQERDEQKALHRAMYASQEARCREYAQDLTDAILTLRRVVVDEIATAAAQVALDRPLHPHEPPAADASGEGER